MKDQDQVQVQVQARVLISRTYHPCMHLRGAQMYLHMLQLMQHTQAPAPHSFLMVVTLCHQALVLMCLGQQPLQLVSCPRVQSRRLPLAHSGPLCSPRTADTQTL